MNMKMKEASDSDEDGQESSDDGRNDPRWLAYAAKAKRSSNFVSSLA
jgi:hypothetical protein